MDDENLEGQGGTISIVAGQVRITDPRGYGHPAVLVVPNDFPLSVTIDGATMGPGEYPVRSEQTVNIAENRIESVCVPQVRASDDKMAVIMSLFFREGSITRVADEAPADRVVLKPQSSTLKPAAPSYDGLSQALTEGNFVGDVDTNALRELSHATVPMERVVLRGKQPFPGKPAECHMVELPREETLDDPLHRRMQLQTVKSGLQVAVIEEEIQPQPGRDVLGRTVPYLGKVRSLLPVLGEGVQRIGNEIFATRYGRLEFSPNVIDVVPRVELNQDITAKDGYVVFDGDVMVAGDVEDGSIINATGIVRIRGGIFGATIIGERGVSIGGHCVKSTVLAGWGRDLVQGCIQVTQTAIGELEDYLTDVERLVAEATVKLPPNRHKELAAIPWIVFDKYHRDVQKAIHNIIKQYANCSGHEVGKRLEPIIRIIRDSWVGSALQSMTSEKIVALLEALESYLKFIEDSRDADEAHIAVAAVTSSNLEATGDITVTGTGTYASELRSGRSIEVKGYVRGGSLWARDSVSVRELGAPSAAETKVVVKNRRGLIRLGIRHPNTLLEVGGRIDRNVSEQRDVNFGN